jgi:hypothetical protein
MMAPDFVAISGVFKTSLPMSTSTDTPNIATARAFSVAVAKGETPEVTECTAVVPAEFWMLYDLFNKSIRWFNAKGIEAKFRGDGNIRQIGFTLIAGKHRFKVNPPGAAKPKGVSDTSKAAYQALDKNKQANELAKVVIELHKEHALVSDNLVAPLVNIPAGRVSARRNEIEKAGSITVDGVKYFFHGYEKIKCPVTGNTVQGWALRKPNTLF